MTPREALADKATRARLLTGAALIETNEVEITQAYKERNMPFVPHPFVGNDLNGLTIVELELADALAARLVELVQ